MAKSRKAGASAPASPLIPPHPRLATPQEIGDLCAEVYRHGVRLARAQEADEEAVEQQALDDVRRFMTACIRDSRSEWKAYSRASGVIAVFADAKKAAGGRARGKAARGKASGSRRR